jgi:hypothetical protein
MKRFLAIAIAATMGLGLFYAGQANAAATGTSGITVVDITSYPVGTAANGVVESRHNLGAFGSYTNTRDNNGNQTGTTQICVFCHTPHHANTDARPLWNRNMPNSSSYVGYGTTIAGTNVAKPKAGSASLACLSCHDGVTTFDNLVNAPGRGTAMPATAWTFFTAGSPIVSNMSFSSRVNLGTDLTNDHPVNVPYSGGTKASLRPSNTTIGTIDLSTGLKNTTAYFGWMQENKWAISGFISSSATIGDLLRSDNTTGNNVECSSCHDPHFSNKSYVEYTRDSNNNFTGLNVGDGVFLRRVGGNTGSGVCRTCHDK